MPAVLSIVLASALGACSGDLRAYSVPPDDQVDGGPGSGNNPSNRPRSPDDPGGPGRVPAANTGELVLRSDIALPGRGLVVTWAPDGRQLAVGGRFRGPSFRYDTQVFDASSGDFLKSFSCHHYWVIANAWQNNPYLGNVIVSGGYDHALKIWNANAAGSPRCGDQPGRFAEADGALRKLSEINGATTAIAFSPDGALLAAANRDHVIRVWQVAPGRNQFKVVRAWRDAAAGNFMSIAWAPDGRRLATGDKKAKRVVEWSLDPSDFWPDEIVDDYAGLDYGDTEGWFKKAENAVWAAGEPLWQAVHGGTVWNVRYAPDGDFLAAASADGTVTVYRAGVESAEPHAQYEAPVEFHGLDWSADGSTVAAGADDGAVYFFDGAELAQPRSQAVHEDIVVSVAFSPDSASIATTGGGLRVCGRPCHDRVDGPDTSAKVWTRRPYEPPPAPDDAGATSSPDAGVTTDPDPDASFPDGPGPGTPPHHEAYQGFGSQTLGGAGGRTITVDEATDSAVRAAFQSARSGNATIVFNVSGPIEIRSPLPRLEGSHITIDGGGVTLTADRLGTTTALIDIRGSEVIVRDMRLRNGGDNLRVQGDDARNVVIAHVSSTGARDDGISIGYGARDVTVQYCFLAGNSRSVFVKYRGTTNVSIHHTWIMKQWIRGPLIHDAFADLRNVIVDDWTLWGSRFEGPAAAGNVVNSLWRLGAHARSKGGKPNGSLFAYAGADRAQVFSSGNRFEGDAQPDDLTADRAWEAPFVTTHSTAQMQGIVESKAGCLPRDAIDRAYIDTRSGWDVADARPFLP